MADVPFNVPYLSGAERGYLEEAFANRVFGGHGPFTKRCMAWLEQTYAVPRAFLTTSCTAALEMSALLLKVGEGDEVIVPSYTFVASASAFLRCGATIVFAEIDPTTYCVDLDDVERKITDRTKAIVPVHYAGIGVDIPRLQAMCAPRGIHIVEDAAQALWAWRDGVRLGTESPFAAFSFHETKNIHAGGLGGALFVNDPAFIERAEYIWHRGTDRTKMLRGLTDKYTWVELGSSFYPSDLQAAFLLAQLEHLDENTAARGVACDAYDEALTPLAERGCFALPQIPEGCRTNNHCWFLVAHDNGEREALREHLAERGVAAYTHYVPLHSSPMGRRLGYTADDLPITEEYAGRILRLPLHTELSRDDIERVTSGVVDFYA